MTGTDTGGDGQQVRALCTPGWVSSTVPDGTWTFRVQMLTAQGALVPATMPTQSTAAEPIASGARQVQFPVISFVPLLASSEGIDAGIDGGFDLADSGYDAGPDEPTIDAAASGNRPTALKLG